jgi:ArsR family transcriptional regulator
METATETLATYDVRLISPEFFKALGDSTRLRLMVSLVGAGEPLCVCEMVYALRVPQYRVSKHLAVLARHGLVASAHRGTWVRYEASEALPKPFRECMLALSVHDPYRADAERLRDRMLLRDPDGQCAVGFLPDEDLKGLIAKAKTCCGR